MKRKYLLTLGFLLFAMCISFAQQKAITGKVVDEDSNPLLGATVVVQNTNRGVQTDFDGNFTIKAAPGEVLEFSYVGFTNKLINVGTASVLNVILIADNTLEEVVVVGYSAQRKSSVTSSVSTVKADEIEQVPLATFDQILQGKATGLEVSSGSGIPGVPARIRIRGTNSILGNSNPLFIVDGITIDGFSFENINPNDIESVSVLKDAQATSLYGARGAAGVIVIETKKGKFGSDTKTQISVRSFAGVSIAPELQVDVLNATQFLQLSRDVGFGQFGFPDLTNATDAQITEFVDGLNGFNVLDDLLRVGRTFSHEISATGGSEKTAFFTSLAYFEQETTVQNIGLQRLAARINLGHKFNDRLDFQLNTSLSFSRQDLGPSSGTVGGNNLGNPFLIPFVGNPTVPIFNDDGTFNTGNPTLPLAGGNVLEDTVFGIREDEEFKLITNLRATYKFTDWLNLSYNVGVDFEDGFSINALNPSTFRGETIPALTDAAGNLFGQQGEASDRDINFTSTVSLNYSDVYADKHAVNASLFFEYNDRNLRTSNFTGFGLEPTLFGFANAITQGTVDNGLIPPVGGVVSINRLASVFANGGYSYDDRYGFNFSLRSDRSSRIAPENSNIIFYSVGGRWSIDNERFLEGVDWIDQLKVRVSFGTTGNDASAGANGFIQQFGRPIFQGQPGLVLGGLANPNSLWEFSEQFNAGLDFGLWKGAVSGSFDIYRSVTRDLFVVQNLPAIFGATAVGTNVGALENEGVELNLTWNILNTQDWQVSIFGNGSYNFNRVTDLGDQIEQFVGGVVGNEVIRVGEQLGTHFVVEFAGVNPANGESLFRDADGNITNVFNTDDSRTGFGSSEPLYTGGFGFNASWKGLGLSTLFSYQAEVTRFNQTNFFIENFNGFLAGGLNQSTAVLDFFQNVGDITDTPAPNVEGVPIARNFLTSEALEDASFIRLRDITLAYSLPNSILKSTFLQSARIYTRGVNLLTFTNFSGLDPEDNNGASNFEFPNARQITFGVDLNF